MRQHFYYPVLKNGHALLTAAKIWFFQPGTTIPVTQDIWTSMDGTDTLPNPWEASPAIIDVWFTTPFRMRLQIEEYLGATYFIEDMDVYPDASDLLFSDRDLQILTGWNAWGMLTANNSHQAVWSTTNVITPADTPIVPAVAVLGPGEGNPGSSPYVNQTVAWSRVVPNTSQGFSPPSEEIHFRLSGSTYIRLAIYVDPQSQQPTAVCQRYVSGVLTSTYFNTTLANIAFPVDGENMVATIKDNGVNLFQGSVSTTVPVSSFVVDITNDSGNSFQSTYLDNSTPPNTIDDSIAVDPIWS